MGNEDVAIGCAKVKQLNAYKKKMVNGKATRGEGKMYFCKTSEDIRIFKENNPDLLVETFDVDLPKSVVKDYIDKGKDQFVRSKPCQKNQW